MLGQGYQACRETIRKAVRAAGWSWKKAKKLLTRANAKKRAAFVEKLKGWLDEAARGQRILVFIDEAHVHQDHKPGYGWFKADSQGHKVDSSSPGLSKKRSLYGIYFYNEGRVMIRDYKRANKTNTVEVLWHINKALGAVNVPVTLIWDGAAYHKSPMVTAAASGLGLELELLPGYSPDLMPVELLWQWLRQEVTFDRCHHSLKQLVERIVLFEQGINAEPFAVADRLVVKTELDPLEEERRLSK